MISIITPVLNGVKYIEYCLRNVIEQNCHDFEHIIIDACSTDGTVEIVKNYAIRYPNIRWISELDKGQSDAMNKGVGLANGDIIGFLNVDDFYEPGVLLRVSDLFKSLPSPSLVVADCNVWDDDGKLLFVVRPSKLKFHQLLLGPRLNLFPVNPSEYFYSKSIHNIIGQYKVDEHYAMDFDFLLRAVRSAKVLYINEIWGNFRLIKGTKTYNDKVINMNNDRHRTIKKSYITAENWGFRKAFIIYKSFCWAKLLFNYLCNPKLVYNAILRRLKP